MTTNKISIKTGPPVEGNDFYGRESELQYAWECHISKGTSLLLSAPRRVGKSSFSKRMLKLAEEKGWKTLYLDLQGVSTESEFVKLFKLKLKSETWIKKTGDTLFQILNGIKEIEITDSKISIDSTVWRSYTFSKLKQLIENAGEILIVVDELAVYLNHLLIQENGKEKVNFILEQLRNFRQTTKARWILCSSVGIENFASMHQLSKHFNDIKTFPIGAFSPSEAKDFISRLDVDESIQFSENQIQHILDKLDWYLPFFIQILVEKINFLICVEDKQLSDDIINEAYNRLITENHFNTWDERLKEYDEFEKPARITLKLCTLPNGRSRSNLQTGLSAAGSDPEKIEIILSRLLEMLKNDGYLVEHKGKYIFRSPLLRDFWHNRFIK